MVTVALMGFASGLPLFLTGFTLKAWLTDSGLDLKAIGLFGLITQPYALKFLWAPILDRYLPPFLGRRRGWMVLAQGALVVLLVLMGLADPRASVTRIAVLGFLVAFASASQDIAVDAWRREAFPEHDLGLANAVFPLADRWIGSGAASIADPVGLTTLSAIVATLGLLATPLLSTDSRLEESDADAFSLRVAHEPSGLAKALVKTIEYRADSPSALEEFLFYDHPSVRRRVQTAMDWKAAHLAQAQAQEAADTAASKP